MLVLALVALLAGAPQDSPPTSTWLDGDPFVAGLFDAEVATSEGPVRAVARNVQGNVGGRPFVNVVRWIDARPFRGKLVALSQRAQLSAPAPDTSVRLWVRVLRADGSSGFEDDGRDQATSSSEWTPLRSIGAIAADATDLAFGLVVEGTTPVNVGAFALDVTGTARAGDLRYSVPQRWIRDADAQCSRVDDPARGFEFRLTTFVPPGHAAADLPVLWLLRDDGDLASTFRRGRALLAGMRSGTEPTAALAFVQPVRTTAGATKSQLAAFESHLLPAYRTSAPHGAGSSTTHVFAAANSAPFVLFEIPGSAAVVSAGRLAVTPPEPLLIDALATADFPERVHLRYARATHDAHMLGDDSLAELLFEASLETFEPWSSQPLGVQQASHSLVGHDCGHDHSDGSVHNH